MSSLPPYASKSTLFGSERFPNNPRLDVMLNALKFGAIPYALPTTNKTMSADSGFIEGPAVPLLAGDVVTNVHACVFTAGAGTSPTSVFLGLVDASGNALGSTADLGADSRWTSTGWKLCALATPYTVTASGLYYPVMLQVGTFGTTQLVVAGMNVGNQLFLGAPNGGSRFGMTSGSGKTSIASFTPSAQTATVPWLAVS